MFNPSRLTLARKRRKFSKKELAEKADISPVTLTRLETNKNNPDIETIKKLSRILNFPIEFFCGDDVDLVDENAISFRSLTTLTAKNRDAAISSTAFSFILHDWVEKRFNIPSPDFIDLGRLSDPESAAMALRQYWGLGEKPISNMIKLLESKGARVFSLSENTKHVNAFCFWREETPYIFLNTFKSAECSRFDAAHELGHLVLHKQGGPKGREAESEADNFASAFLMPKVDIISNTPTIKTIDQLIYLKKRWKVSVAALTYRLHKIGLLSDWQYRTLFIHISKKGYRTNEPQGIDNECSVVWEQIFRELWKDKITKDKLASYLSIPVDEIGKLVFGLSSNTNSHSKLDIEEHKGDRLRLVKNEPSG